MLLSLQMMFFGHGATTSINRKPETKGWVDT